MNDGRRAAAAMATDHERSHLMRLRDEHLQQMERLELQAAKYGLSVPPHILEDIEERKAAIAQLDKALAASAPPAASAPTPIAEVILALPPDERWHAIVYLVMELQKDFVACRGAWNMRLRMLMIGAALFAAAVLASVVMQWIAFTRLAERFGGW